MSRGRLLGTGLGLVMVSAMVLLGPPAADASCRYVPTVADGRFQGPFTISSGTQDLDVFFQSRYGSSYSVEAMIVSEPYYAGSLSGNLDVADCPTTDYEFLRRTETIDPAPADFLFSGQGVRPYYRASFYGLHGGVGYADFRIGNTLANPVAVVVSVTETTMFSPAWSTNGSYDTYYSLQNTTNDVCFAALILLAPDGTYTVSTGATIPPGRTAALNTVTMNAPRNRTGTAKVLHDCPPGGILAAAAIANFTISPTPYYQGVKFEPVRAAH